MYSTKCSVYHSARIYIFLYNIQHKIPYERRVRCTRMCDEIKLDAENTMHKNIDGITSPFFSHSQTIYILYTF